MVAVLVFKEVVELIREDLTTATAGLSEDGGGGGGGTVAEKIVVSSLRSLSAEERGPVERTFLLLAVFPEMATIPMAVLDALFGLDEEEGNSGEVISAGPGHYAANGELRPTTVAVGDSVMYARHAGDEATVEGKTFKIVSEADCLVKW